MEIEPYTIDKKQLLHNQYDGFITFTTFILTLIVVISIWVFLGIYHKNNIRKDTIHELSKYSDSLVGQQLESIKYVLESLATHAEIVKLGINQGGQTKQLEKYLNGVATGSGASIVYILDTKGTVIGCNRYGNNKTLLGKNYSFRKYFIDAIGGNDVVFPAVGVTTNKRGLYFSTPVYSDSEKSEIIAVAVIKMGVQRIEHVLSSMKTPSSIITPSGVVFISNEKEFLFKLTRNIKDKKLIKIIDSRQFGKSKMESIPGRTVSENEIFKFKHEVTEKMELLFPNWYLVQWRVFEYPVKIALILTILAIILVVSAGLIVSGKINQNVKDKELKIAKKTAEDNLREGYETLRRILQSSPVAVFVCRNDMQIAWLNKTARDMLAVSSYGEAKSLLFGKQLDVTDEDGTSLIKSATEARILNTEAILTATADREIPVLFNRTSFSRGNENLFLYSFLDLSERKQMEAELVHTRKMESIGQLAAGVAHEINSPAQFVASNIDFIIEALPDLFSLINKYESVFEKLDSKNITDKQTINNLISTSKEEADYDYLSEELPMAATQSKEGIERISKIVLAMKAFSHPGDGNTMQHGDINNAIETTITVAANEWKNIAEIKLDLDPDLPQVPCFLGQLNQVLLNLIVNGAHAIENKKQNLPDFKKGLLTIVTKHDENFVSISVSDTGTGIPEEHRAKLFDPFFTTKDVGKGSGQGLYIAHTLIHDQHKGTLTFDTKDGEGTTFTIRLPIHELEG